MQDLDYVLSNTTVLEISFNLMVFSLSKGRQMIEHTKKLVEEKFTVLGGYEHTAEVFSWSFWWLGLYVQDKTCFMQIGHNILFSFFNINLTSILFIYLGVFNKKCYLFDMNRG